MLVENITRLWREGWHWRQPGSIGQGQFRGFGGDRGFLIVCLLLLFSVLRSRPLQLGQA
jgi:hypothetical protein